MTTRRTNGHSMNLFIYFALCNDSVPEKSCLDSFSERDSDLEGQPVSQSPHVLKFLFRFRHNWRCRCMEWFHINSGEAECEFYVCRIITYCCLSGFPSTVAQLLWSANFQHCLVRSKSHSHSESIKRRVRSYANCSHTPSYDSKLWSTLGM